MTAFRITALLGAIAMGFLVKQVVFPLRKVAADVRPAVAMDILQMHRRSKRSLPVQATRDMTFVFEKAGDQHSAGEH